MSARGARSRKDVTKDIEKHEKKAAIKGKAVETIRRPNDAFGGWQSPLVNPQVRSPGVPTRHPTIVSEASRATSRSDSTDGSNPRPPLQPTSSHDSHSHSFPNTSIHRSKTSLSNATSISDDSPTMAKDKSKFVTKGKETKAPRGRGGGVPVKMPAASKMPLRTVSIRSGSLPGNGTTQYQKNWQDFRVWSVPPSGEQPLKPYAGFEFDVYMQTGSVLIYFKEEQRDEDRPIPQLRAELDVLENAGSTWLSNALLFGQLDDDALDEWLLPGSPDTSISPQALSPNFPSPPGHRMLAPSSPPTRSPPPFLIDQQYIGGPGSGASSVPSYSDSGAQSPYNNGQPTHELWFAAPAHLDSPWKQRLHHVAIRNFIAMLHNKPIVGADFFDMLTSLHSEIQVMYDLDHENADISSNDRAVQMIINHITEYKLDDVRKSIKQAMCLLAWSELDFVKWEHGYLESFVHLVGVMVPALEEVPEYKRLSLTTRRNLGFASKQLQLRVMEAEEKLGPFDFEDLWEDSAKMAIHPVHQSYQAFRKFLINYYKRIYGNWPPVQGKSWLNRKIVLELQQDFGALYDYLVNRNVTWDSREERPGKKWIMVNRKMEEFGADQPDLSITGMLVTFDNKHGYQHIPHPFPLLPREVPHIKPTTQKKGLFSSLKKNKSEPAKDVKAHLKLSIIYSDATNVEKLDDSFSGSALIDAFETFELSAELALTKPRPTFPHEARLGRWILLYAILQTLSTLSVDVPSLKYTDSVRYFLNTDLRRIPSWVTHGEPERHEAKQTASWCWNRSWDETPRNGAPVELDGVGVVRNEGDTMRPFSPRNALSDNMSTPPPAPHPRALSPTTSLQADIHRINEKITHLNLSSPHSPTLNISTPPAQDTHPASRTRRPYDSEKSLQQEFSHTRGQTQTPRYKLHPHTGARDATLRLASESLPDRILTPEPDRNGTKDSKNNSGDLGTDIDGIMSEYYDYATRSIPDLPGRSPLRSVRMQSRGPSLTRGDGGVGVGVGNDDRSRSRDMEAERERESERGGWLYPDSGDEGRI